MSDIRKLAERIIREAEAAADGPEYDPLAVIERVLREHGPVIVLPHKFERYEMTPPHEGCFVCGLDREDEVHE